MTREKGEHGGKTYKVDTDGRDVALGVGVVGKSKKQTTLADTRVANEQQLEKVIAVRWRVVGEKVRPCHACLVVEEYS